MKFKQLDDDVEIHLNQQEFNFLYMTVYAAIQFVDNIDFAAVTGLFKEDARRFLDEANKSLRSRKSEKNQ